jgi:hypothetical protein
MDSNEVVERQIYSGRRLLDQLVRDGFNVAAAFWVKPVEEESWFLYIASPIVDEKGTTAAYGILHASLQQLEDISLSFSDLKLVRADHPIGRDMLAILARHPGRMATRLGRRRLGDMMIEEAYIYPADLFAMRDPAPLTRDEVLQKLFELMSRGPGSLQPSRVTARDGTSFLGVPFSIQRVSPQTLVVQFVGEGESAQAFRVDEISSIE